MGLDLKAIADAIMSVSYQSWLIFFSALLLTLLLLRSSGFFARLGKLIEELFFTNWQLALLASTGLVLSLASGYTTWDGMRNFTGHGLLSLMITFGIQGVMLIVAWLIGESFATGMSRRSASGGRGLGVVQPFVASICGILLFAALLVWGMRRSGVAFVDTHVAETGWLGALAGSIDTILIVAIALLLAATVLVNRSSDIVEPYVQSARVMARTAVLWVMFLACMATSVFFSFDSLFSAIFPQTERQRAAELRAQNQVAGIVADIGTTIETKRLAEAQRLFHSRDNGWQAYEGQLTRLTQASQGAEKEIESYFVQQMEARRRGIAEQQERASTAVGGQAGLNSKKNVLMDELARLKGERPTLAGELAERKTELDNRAKAVDAKRVDAIAEEKGAEGTLKIGRGPVYRQRSEELSRLQEAYKIQDDRVRDAQKRLAQTDTRIAQIERELAGVDGEIGKLKGEAQAAEERIKTAEAAKIGDDGPRVDPARVRGAFETARTEFHQEPTAERLGRVQQFCSQLLNAMASAPATRDRVRGIDCDPKQAFEAATVVFALNDGSRVYASQCAGGDKLAEQKSADQLFGFARKCLADSGLPSRETDALRSKINFIELSRDDKAHRFVVTWNAFNDGNRLAYLALAIAIAIDALVFMSGLFGANAVRSPLSDVPSFKARSAAQLEAIIDNALLPDRFENAQIALEALHPITPVDGFTQEVLVGREMTPSRARLLKVLNAGATIGAVVRDEPSRGDPRDRYLVRPELFEFLSVVSKTAYQADKDHARRSELEKIVMVSLLPDVSQAVDSVMSHLHPIDEQNGFTSEVFLNEIEPEFRRPVRNVLNAGATLRVVQRDPSDPKHYFIHAELYTALARIRARMLLSAAPGALQIGTRPAASYGGALDSRPRELPPGEPARRQIGAQPSATRDSAQHGRSPGERTLIRAAAQQASHENSLFDDAQLIGELRWRLLGPVGLSSTAYDEVEKSERAAHEAGEAFVRLAGSHYNLGEIARMVLKDGAGELNNEYDHLKSEYETRHDTHYVELLDRVRRELENRLAALLLTTGGPYEKALQSRIDDYEESAGEGSLTSHEDQLLTRFRAHLGWLKSHARLTSKGWSDLAHELGKYVEPRATAPQGGQDGKPMLN